MKAFLYLFYHSVKLLVLVIFRFFYSQKIILNKQNLRIDNPCILLSNHPNTLHDPLQVAAKVDNRMVHFLANAGLFSTSIGNWFFSTFYCIKIERAQDVNGRKISNDKAFEACDRFLTGGGTLYIAPEGTSKVERHVRKIKTGTARIALSAEEKNDFQLGLTLLPVGLNYSDATSFREKILINVGEPIYIHQYKADYEKDPVNAVHLITDQIAKSLQELIIHTNDEEEEILLTQIEEIYQSDDAITFDQQFFRSKKLLAQLRSIQENTPKDFESLVSLLKKYKDQLAALSTNDFSLTRLQEKLNFSAYLYYIVGFVPFLWGWINNYIACYIPAWLNRKLKLYIGYSSTVKSLAGMITIPLFYAIQTALVYHFSQSWLWALAYLASLIPVGLFAWNYHKKWKKDRAIFKLKNKYKQTPNPIDALLSIRNQIKALLKSPVYST